MSDSPLNAQPEDHHSESLPPENAPAENTASPERILSRYPSRQRFEEIVEEALASIPDELWKLIDNVAVMVEEWPLPYQLESVGLRNPRALLGLYEGIPLTHRTHSYGIVAPDRVTIFRRPIFAACGPNENAIREQIRRTVLHEIAHHFGISDARLIEIGAY
jgi:predicted Zn-dependent protease with MMP-like domain